VAVGVTIGVMVAGALGEALCAALSEADSEAVSDWLNPGDSGGGALERAPTQPAPASNMTAATAAHLRGPRRLANIDATVAPPSDRCWCVYDAAFELPVMARRAQLTGPGTPSR
jgi:hypothetical protein